MRTDPNCIFCKIVAKQIPAMIIHETDAVIAFLDVNPLAEGHLLVIPREHSERIADMSSGAFGQLTGALPSLGHALLKVSGTSSYNVLQNNGAAAGQMVPHVHFHLIPRKHDDGLGFRWNPGSYPAGRDAEITAAFRAALGDGV